MTIHVKICGITSLDDARCALAAGADYLGFNLFPRSPRYIEPAAIRTILDGLRTEGTMPRTVGIFVNTPAPAIQSAMTIAGLDYIQLHGDEPPETLAALAPRAFKALRPQSVQEAEELAARFHTGTVDNGPGLLLDAYDAAAYGGTGKAVDRQIAGQLAAHYTRFLLAGGLTPDNVTQAIEHVRPWGVDVSSGVESAPGRKDHQKIIRFVAAVRAAATNYPIE